MLSRLKKISCPKTAPARASRSSSAEHQVNRERWRIDAFIGCDVVFVRLEPRPADGFGFYLLQRRILRLVAKKI